MPLQKLRELLIDTDFKRILIKSINIIHFIAIYFGFSFTLYSEPEDLDVFFDFENITGAHDFTIGESPTSVRIIGFTAQATGNPDLSHSGSRALILNAGEEGKIIFERGVNLLQFYAGETMGLARIELRDKNLLTLHPNGVVEELPRKINPANNPRLQSFVAFSGDNEDLEDLNFTNGIKELKIINVSEQFTLDDLGFSYVVGPPNNLVFEDFEGLVNHPIFSDPAKLTHFTLGQPPASATFTGGFVQTTGVIIALQHTFPFGVSPYGDRGTWTVFNNTTGTIIFDTPALQVQFYAANFDKDDGELKVFDTDNNLLLATTDIPQSISINSSKEFTYFDFNANELGAPEGIGKITYTNNPKNATFISFNYISIDDFGFTPIAQPSSLEELNLEPDDLIISGSGNVIGTNILHSNGNIFDQILLSGEMVMVRADVGQITRVSYLDENDDIVQVEFSGSGSLTIILDSDTFNGPELPVKYDQPIEYVKGHASFIIRDANDSTFFSVFTVGPLNAINQSLFPTGIVYDAQADISYLEVSNSTAIGGIQCSNARFSASRGRIGIEARAVPVAVRLLVGDIVASGTAIPYLLFGNGSFTKRGDNPGLRIMGGNLKQSNGSSIIVALNSTTIPGFNTLISQNNIKSNYITQPTQSIDASFVNEEGTEVFIIVVETTVN